MNWKQLLSTKRMGDQGHKKQLMENDDQRTAFEKDYRRIINSTSFRRLQDKTQVFPLDRTDFIRTRLTHSLEVSSLAKSLGQHIFSYILEHEMDEDMTYTMKEDICTILMCAGLIHDIGNPPFGHFGEDSIREWFQKHLKEYTFKGTPVTELLTQQQLKDLYYYEGNAQAFRLVSRLQFFNDENGLNLTYALLSTIMKYPCTSLQMDPAGEDIARRKMGVFASEEELFHKISTRTGTNGRRHPLSYILEAADDIAYLTADVEDAYKKGHITYDILLRELPAELSAYPAVEEFDMVGTLQKYNRRFREKNVLEPRLYAVQNWLSKVQSYLVSCAARSFIERYDTIMAGELKSDLFAGTGGEPICMALHNIAFRNAFESMPILRIEVGAARMVDSILDHLIPAFILYDTDEKPGIIEYKMTQIVAENYKQVYQTQSKNCSEEEKLYQRILLATDYLSGMTDSFARDLYLEINGML